MVDDTFAEILRRVIQSSLERSKTDKVSHALLLLLVREANTWRTIRTLKEHTPDAPGFMVDAGVLLRCMFDACLQAAFICKEPARQLERANLYLDFEHVDRYKIARKVVGHDNPLADRLRASPRKAEGEPRLQEEYDRVKGQFPKRRQNGTRDKWYEGDLRQLAQDAGKEAEYDTFVTQFSGCVHSSAFAVGRGPMVSPKYVVYLATTVAAQVAKLNVAYNKLELGEEESILDELCKGLLDKK
jgi:hypothetical protein